MRERLHAVLAHPVLRVFAVALVVLVGAWLRLRYTGTRGLHLDEFVTVWNERVSSVSELWGRAPPGFDFPLFPLLVHITVRLFGESETTVRLPAAVLGSLVPLFAWFAGSRAFGRRAGAAAALILAWNPQLVLQASTARLYPMGELGSVFAAAFLGRALATGKPLDRALMWAGAVVAVCGHFMFATVCPVLVVAAAFARSPSYPLKKIVQDAALAFVALLPAIFEMQRVFASKGDLRAPTAPPSSAVEVFQTLCATPEQPWVVLLAVLAPLVAYKSWRGAPVEKGYLAFGVLAVVGQVTLVLALTLRGSNMIHPNYAALATLGAALLAGACLARVPRLVAAAALFVIVGWSSRLQIHNWSQEWRETEAELASLQPGRDPVLFMSGHYYANVVVKHATPEIKEILASPLECQPGKPPPRYEIILLTFSWNIPGQPAYFEKALVPVLDRVPRFYVVAHPLYAERLEDWMRKRLPHRNFQCTHRSREFVGPNVVLRYELR